MHNPELFISSKIIQAAVSVSTVCALLTAACVPHHVEATPTPPATWTPSSTPWQPETPTPPPTKTPFQPETDTPTATATPNPTITPIDTLDYKSMLDQYVPVESFKGTLWPSSLSDGWDWLKNGKVSWLTTDPCPEPLPIPNMTWDEAFFAAYPGQAPFRKSGTVKMYASVLDDIVRKGGAHYDGTGTVELDDWLIVAELIWLDYKGSINDHPMKFCVDSTGHAASYGEWIQDFLDWARDPFFPPFKTLPLFNRQP